MQERKNGIQTDCKDFLAKKDIGCRDRSMRSTDQIGPNILSYSLNGRDA